MYTYQRPEDGEYPGGTKNQKAAQRLGVVGLHHLDGTQQGFDPRPPQVAHVQALQVHQAGPRTAGGTGASRSEVAHLAQCPRAVFLLCYSKVISIYSQKETI